MRGLLLDIERAGWDSLCNGTGGQFYATAMTTDAVMVMANGQVMTRDEVVESMDGTAPWASYEIDHVREVPIGIDSIALVYVGTGRRANGADPFTGAMTSVYVRQGRDWKLALYQQTPIANNGRKAPGCHP